MNDLPAGAFVYPTKIRKSMAPLFIGLLLVLGAAGAAVYFVVLKKEEPPAAASAPSPSEPVAAATPAIDAAEAPAVEPDAAIVAEKPATPTATATTPATPPPATRPSDRAVASRTTTPTTRTPPRTREQPAAADTKPPIAETPPKEPEPAPPPKSNDDPGCDEVSCVLEKYARPCCAKYKPADDKFQPSVGTSENLEKPQIKAGIDRIRPKVQDCATQHKTKGTVKVGVSVDGEGVVEEVTVKEAPDDALGNCVASAVKRAKFAKTTNGGTFTYPFVF